MTDKYLNLTLFSGTNTTGQTGMGQDLSAEMKTYYDDLLIDNAEPNLVHDQFGQKKPIPKNRGKVIEFRRYSQLPKLTTPITEGVTPEGQKLNVTTVTATVNQYGGYIELSDMLTLTAVDRNLVESTKLLGSQAGRTLDTIVREVLNGGTNVQYAEGQVAARNLLAGGKTEGNMYLTVKAIQMAARTLKNANADTIDGYYVAIIHPNVAYDIMRDPEWISASQYAGSMQIFEGEIGRIGKVRFVESTEAKIFEKGGAESVDVYSTLVLGANAYGTTEISGGGLEMIIKQLGSGGTSDPLNQRATTGWKATKTAARLLEEAMVRIETASSAPALS